MIPISWLLLAIFIGYLGRDRLLGFWGNFFISIVFTPLIGALVVAATREVRRHA